MRTGEFYRKDAKSQRTAKEMLLNAGKGRLVLKSQARRTKKNCQPCPPDWRVRIIILYEEGEW
jgi:hypothetical protein